MSFERNFYKSSAVCPKCGSNAPQPKYIPHDHTWASFALENWTFLNRISRDTGRPEQEKFDYNSKVVPDKVVCLCRCGYEWEEKEAEQNEKV